MSRKVAAVFACLFVAGVGIHAQEPQSSPFRIAPAVKPVVSASPVSSASPVIQPARIFSKASIDKAIVVDPKMTLARSVAPAPRAPRSFKSFFKTPWPYIIGGAVAAGIIIAMNSGSGDGTGGIY